MNGRQARRFVLQYAASHMRVTGDSFAQDEDTTQFALTPADRRRVAAAFHAFSEQLERRADPARQRCTPDPVDPDQIPLFEEGSP